MATSPHCQSLGVARPPEQAVIGAIWCLEVMPRKARIDAPGVLHQNIIRGIERKAIFKDTADRENFFERFGHVITETETGCYAWVYMRNHYVLNLFGQSENAARRAYKSFVAQGVKHGRRPDLVGGC